MIFEFGIEGRIPVFDTGERAPNPVTTGPTGPTAGIGGTPNTIVGFMTTPTG